MCSKWNSLPYRLIIYVVWQVIPALFDEAQHSCIQSFILSNCFILVSVVVDLEPIQWTRSKRWECTPDRMTGHCRTPTRIHTLIHTFGQFCIAKLRGGGNRRTGRKLTQGLTWAQDCTTISGAVSWQHFLLCHSKLHLLHTLTYFLFIHESDYSVTAYC